jgi:hypothetical protein
MVDKVALGQVFLRVIRLSPVNIIPTWLSILLSLGYEQQARWWPQFRDVVSPYQHEHEQQGQYAATVFMTFCLPA